MASLYKPPCSWLAAGPVERVDWRVFKLPLGETESFKLALHVPYPLLLRQRRPELRFQKTGLYQAVLELPARPQFLLAWV